MKSISLSETPKFYTNVEWGSLFLQESLKKCQRCMEVIIDAKERQAAEANKNATILLQEIDQEKVSIRSLQVYITGHRFLCRLPL